MSSITWSPYVWPELHPAHPQELHKLEVDWGVILPDDYKKIVARYQGCSPSPHGVKLPKGDTGVGVLLTVSDNSAMPDESIREVYGLLKEHAPPRLYPFARDIGSTYFCFDYRRGPRNPRVVFFNHEEEGEDAIIFLADSFTQFLNDLREGE